MKSTKWDRWVRKQSRTLRSRLAKARASGWELWLAKSRRNLNNSQLRANARAVGEARPTEAGIREKLTEQRRRCSLTGVPLTPESASIDHIQSLKKGGAHAMDNLQIVHREVNQMKGSMSVDEFVDWCRLVVEHAE